MHKTAKEPASLAYLIFSWRSSVIRSHTFSIAEFNASTAKIAKFMEIKIKKSLKLPKKYGKIIEVAGRNVNSKTTELSFFARSIMPLQE